MPWMCPLLMQPPLLADFYKFFIIIKMVFYEIPVLDLDS